MLECHTGEPAVFVLRTGYLMPHKDLSCPMPMSGGTLTLEPGLAVREAALNSLQLTCEQQYLEPKWLEPKWLA